jgi:hypothetical protein
MKSSKDYERSKASEDPAMRSQKSGVSASKQPSMMSSQHIGSEEDKSRDESQELDYDQEDEDDLQISQNEVREELLLAIADAIQ